MKPKPPGFYLILAVVCFAIAAISLTGFVLKGDSTGQLIFGAVWVFVGFGWIGRAIRARRMNRVRLNPPSE